MRHKLNPFWNSNVARKVLKTDHIFAGRGVSKNLSYLMYN